MKPQIQPHFEIMDQTFDQTCCREKGVTEECMANCMDAQDHGLGWGMEKHKSRCTKFEKLIKECIVSKKPGNFTRFPSHFDR